jgi:L-asparaginase
MPAGNYATKQAGVSCTGVGEDIINECLAAKIVIRVGDGLSLPQAVEKSMQEAKSRNGDLAAISLDHSGAIAWGKTCPILLGAYHTGEKMGDTLEWGEEELMGYIA